MPLLCRPWQAAIRRGRSGSRLSAIGYPSNLALQEGGMRDFRIQPFKIDERLVGVKLNETVSKRRFWPRSRPVCNSGSCRCRETTTHCFDLLANTVTALRSVEGCVPRSSSTASPDAEDRINCHAGKWLGCVRLYCTRLLSAPLFFCISMSPLKFIPLMEPDGL